MAEKLGLDDGVRELKLGSSFDRGGPGPEAYHSIRYDFKPASVDKTQMSSVEVGEGNSITVTVPHVEGSGTSQTVYKGNKRPCQKECVLIIDHQTGEITLEKLSSNIHLKKTRQEGSSRAGLQQQQRPHTPTDKTKDLKTSPPKRKKLSPTRGSQQSSSQGSVVDSQQVAARSITASPQMAARSITASPQMAAHGTFEPIPAAPKPSIPPPSKTSPDVNVMSKNVDVDVMSSSSSSSDSSSDSEDDDNKPPPKLTGSATVAAHPAPAPSHKDYHMLSMDLQLSDSGSDSD